MSVSVAQLPELSQAATSPGLHQSIGRELVGNLRRVAYFIVSTTVGFLELGDVMLPPAMGWNGLWGTVGLTARAGAAGWLEFLLLCRAFQRRMGPAPLPRRFLAQLCGAVLGSLMLRWPLHHWLRWPRAPILEPLWFLGLFAAGSGATTLALGVPEARSLRARLLP